MRVFITNMFNEKMKKLSKPLQQKVAKLFSFVNKAEKKEIFNSSLLVKVNSKDNKLFVFQKNNIQIFFTHTFHGNEIALIFITVAFVDEGYLDKKT